MAQATLERLTEEIKTLTPGEQEQLRALLDQEIAPARAESLSQQQRLLERLRDKGIIAAIPSGLHRPSSGDLHPPIEVQGRPVSETLLEERR